MITPIRFEVAEDFLNLLRRSNSEWRGATTRDVPWVFRGQTNANWDLLPSAWRPPEVKSRAFDRLVRWQAAELRQNGIDHIDESLIVTMAECQALLSFAVSADALGFSVPLVEMTGKFTEKLQHRNIHIAPRIWEELAPIAPLAQHHGIPTRLLDWTNDPIVAAFFAVHRATLKDEVCVWAINPTEASVKLMPDDLSLDILYYPRKNHEFLRAQNAVATVLRGDPGHYYELHGSWPSLAAIAEAEDEETNWLRKIVLPADCVGTVQILLEREFINIASMMPTLDNVAGHVSQMWEQRQFESAIMYGFRRKAAEMREQLDPDDPLA